MMGTSYWIETMTAVNELEATAATTPASTSTVNSRIIIDSPDDIMPIQSDTDSVRSSVIFFSASLSIFAIVGVILFCRKCVNCPTDRHGRRRHYYAGGGGGVGGEATFRAVMSAPTVVVVETDAGGMDATTPLTPSPADGQDDEAPSPSCSSRRLSRGLADSTSAFPFYDDDVDDVEEEDST